VIDGLDRLVLGLYQIVSSVMRMMILETLGGLKAGRIAQLNL